jgi:hypothetical protein
VISGVYHIKKELPDEIPWYEAVDEGVGGVDDA